MESTIPDDDFKIVERPNTQEFANRWNYSCDLWSEEKRQNVMKAILELDPSYEFDRPEDLDMAEFTLQNREAEHSMNNPDKSPLYPFLYTGETTIIHITEPIYDIDNQQMPDIAAASNEPLTEKKRQKVDYQLESTR